MDRTQRWLLWQALLHLELAWLWILQWVQQRFKYQFNYCIYLCLTLFDRRLGDKLLELHVLL